MPQIDRAIPTEAFEIVRNRIGEILIDELAYQYYLTGTPVLAATVYIERSVTLAWNEMPAVNILLARGDMDNHDQGHTDGTYTFNIDCYAASKTVGNQRGDVLAALDVQKLMGVCRAILEDPIYKTLGIAPPSISNRRVVSATYFDPENTQDSASTMRGRITFSVRVTESSQLITGTLLTGFDTRVKLGATSEGFVYEGNGTIAKPYNLEYTYSGAGITLTWSDINTGEDGFKIERALSYEGPYAEIGQTLPDVHTFLDDTAEPLLFYFYRVRVFNDFAAAVSDPLAAIGSKPITIFNAKTTPQELLSDLTEDTTLPNMTVVVHSALGSSQSLSVAVPPDGSTLHVHLEDSNGDDASIPVGTTTYNENIDHIFVPLGNIAITDSVDSFISAQFLIGQTPRTTVKDRDANTLTTDSFTKVGTNGLTITIDESTAIAAADFSQADNYTAFLGNETAKAAPVRMPAQPLGGTPLFDGSLDYLYNLGRFSDELINPPGRTKVKKLATFLTLHPDNPRPDGGFDRFQPVSVVFSTFPAITFDCYVDWWQELFLMPPSEAVQVVRAINVHVQHQYEDAITIHPMLRLARKEEVDLMYLYPTTASALPAKVYPTATNNSFRTCTVVTGTTSIVTARDRMIPDHQGMLPWNSLSNIGPPLLVCFLEEIMNEDLNLI